MNDSDARAQAPWMWTNLVLITLSAAAILHPPLRLASPFALAFTAAGAVYFFMMLRRLRRAGSGDMTLGQIYLRARAGRRFHAPALEWAAIVAFALATFR
jgi:hypothetical protein